MDAEESLTLLKALADKSRLAIINSLLEGSQYVEELAKRHALAPSTVSFHLRKLEQAGLINSHKEQYYVMVKLNEAVFDTPLRRILTTKINDSKLQQQRMDAYRRKVLEAFFTQGRLDRLPAQKKKRLIVLQEFARRFEGQKRYSEEEVTQLILPLHDDYCLIRRLLVDEGLLNREGAVYWRENGDEDIPGNGLPPTAKRGSSVETQKNLRRQIKQELKQKQPEMGIFQIRCLGNGKIYIAASQNLESERKSRLFQLKMGKAVFNRDLQLDLERYGSQEFEFSVLESFSPEKEQDPAAKLARREVDWLEKLHPFGDSGYNSLKGLQRQKEKLALRGL